MTRPRFTYDESICRECLKDEDDVRTIRELVEKMPLIADLIDGNIFVDCPTDDPDNALCVAEAFPMGEEPLYTVCPVGADCPRAKEPAALRTLSLGVVSRDILGVSQEMFPISQVTVPIFGKDLTKPIGVLIRETPPNEAEQAEKKLSFIQEASSSFTDAVYGLAFDQFNIPDQIKEAIVIFDYNGIVTYRNQGAVKLYKSLGYREDLMGMPFMNVSLTKDSFESLIGETEFREVFIGGYSLEVKYSRKTIEHGTNVCMVIHDVTGEDEAKKKVRLQSYLISEMNHRIKNNLQTVASILNLQANRIEDPAIQEMFMESTNRILSIAEVHNQLSMTGGDTTDLHSLTEDLCKNLARFGDLEYHVTGETTMISATKASAYGLVINELAQNVAKHAVPPAGERKRISIAISMTPRYIYATVSDNGKGCFSLEKKNLGLSLVERLVNEVLKGNFEIKNGEDNSIISILFPR